MWNLMKSQNSTVCACYFINKCILELLTFSWSFSSACMYISTLSIGYISSFTHFSVVNFSELVTLKGDG